MPYNSLDMEYAVIETGGKQYAVRTGDTIKVERLEMARQQEQIELDRVLMVARNGVYDVGKPVLEGVKVKAEVLGEGRAPKIIVFKYKNKTRYRRKRGHLQPYTHLRITEIVTGETTPTPRRRTRTNRSESDGS